MDTAKVTTKGQITIPVSVRREFGLSQGSKVCFLNENGRLYLEISEESTENEKKALLKSLCGSIDEPWIEPQEIPHDYDRKLENLI
jgi:AbrB family looped-hinge helix DNA binding protein